MYLKLVSATESSSSSNSSSFVLISSLVYSPMASMNLTVEARRRAVREGVEVSERSPKMRYYSVRLN